MARLDALPSFDIIHGFQGVLDFYLWKGLPCVRMWPRMTKAQQSPATRQASALFGQILKGYRLLADTVLEAFQEQAQGETRTARDIYVSATLGHLHERTEPVTPPVHFTTWMPDAPPLAPSALDDEFDDADFDLGLWTEFDPGGLLTVSENETGLLLDEITQAGDDICGIYQAIPAVDFTITAKLGLTALRLNFGVIGLALWDDAANPAAGLYVWILTYRTADQQLELTRFTNHTTWHSAIWNAADLMIATDIYLRIRRIAANYFFDWSTDGLGWQNPYSGVLAFAPDHFGIIVNNVNTGITIRGVATFFRYTPYGTFSLILQGDRVSVMRNVH